MKNLLIPFCVLAFSFLISNSATAQFTKMAPSKSKTLDIPKPQVKEINITHLDVNGQLLSKESRKVGSDNNQPSKEMIFNGEILAGPPNPEDLGIQRAMKKDTQNKPTQPVLIKD